MSAPRPRPTPKASPNASTKRHPSSRARIQPYLSLELSHRFRNHCATTGTTESAVVEAALLQYLDHTGDRLLFMRRLDRLGRGVERLTRDLDILSEAFATWVELWFAHTPTVAEDAKAHARRSAQIRFQKFIEHVGAKLSGGHRFVDDLAKEDLADERELAALAADAVAGEPPKDAPNGESP